MSRRVIHDEVIPARHGMAFRVNKGQVLRIYLVEDRQVGDCAFFNANDYKEAFHVGQTWAINDAMGTGNARFYRYFYSKPPRENLMFTVLEDTVRNHWANMGGRCSRKYLERVKKITNRRSCQQNLEEALAPHGLTGDDIIDVFNVFMNVEVDSAGRYQRRAPTAMKGDHIDLLAEMDILAAISACPGDSIVNDYRPKPLGVQILE